MTARKLALILFLIFSMQVFAQKTILKKTINMVSSENPKQTIARLETDYAIPFVYSDNIFDNKQFAQKKYIQISLHDFLVDYFSKQDISFKEVNGQIILFYQAYEPQNFVVSGFVRDENSGEDLIGATVFFPDLGIGAITNSYGYFALQVPEGKHKIVVNCLSYSAKDSLLNIVANRRFNIALGSKSYRVQEITIQSEANTYFLESALMNMEKIDIEALRKLPGLFGESDALRNLSIFPGIQTNELSTSSINVRGGSTDQTLFLMDEANLYNASHFGGMFSVFNPEVVNNVNVYKSDIPIKEGGALSSLIDVRLREGNKQHWKLNGGIGLISARASLEGPLVKEESSVLFAFRRTYVDQIIHALTTDKDLDNLNFYFYDANLKMNYKLNKNNRLFLSGYSGADEFEQYSKLTRENHLVTLRWNHIFTPNLFSNTSVIGSKNIMTQGSDERDAYVYWKSDVNNVKIKSDVTYYITDDMRSSFGYNANLYNIKPYAVLSELDNQLNTRFESERERLLLNSLYFSQRVNIKKVVSIDGGIRLTYMSSNPVTDSLVGLEEYFLEPQVKIGFTLKDKSTIKASFCKHVQPLHQLPLSMIGIAINRWMPANKSFRPQVSHNYSIGYYNKFQSGLKITLEAYYRKMDNLIESFGNLEIIGTSNPEEIVRKAKGTAKGLEFLISYNSKKYRAIATYDYCKALWVTDGLNNNLPYPASHTREHSFNISQIYSFSDRVSLSATWTIASGIPFTAAFGFYQVTNKTYLAFDGVKINTKRLPPYHRLDISLDIASKKNEHRKWKSYWNFSVYNAYFHKNALGVAYFVPDENSGTTAEFLRPGYFYLYQFVPSVSYRFSL